MKTKWNLYLLLAISITFLFFTLSIQSKQITKSRKIKSRTQNSFQLESNIRNLSNSISLKTNQIFAVKFNMD